MTKLHLVIKLNDLSIVLCDRDNNLIDVSIKGTFFDRCLWFCLVCVKVFIQHP